MAIIETKFFKPHPSLQHVVHNIMVARTSYPLNHIVPVTPFPPLSQHALYFYVHDRVNAQLFGGYDNNVMPKSMIIGPQLIRVNLHLGHDNLVVRVGFQPGGLHRLVKFGMYKILDYACDAEAVFGNVVNEVHEKLNESDGFINMKNIVESFLMSYAFHETTPFIKAVKYLVHHNGNVPIKDLAWQAGLSTRQFERNCNEYLGLSPKIFARLTRFSKAYRIRQSTPNLSWTTIAYQCGYFDQMHFIRDFKEFAGVTPKFMEKELYNTPFKVQQDISF